MRSRLFFILLFVTKTVLANDPYPRNDAIDVIHYEFRIELNDTTDRIAGEAIIRISFKKSISEFELDLAGREASRGMTVMEVTSDGQPVKFSHANNRIRIMLPQPSAAPATRSFTIRYAGVPREGLVIGKNKYGDRCFFGDNWPDRGHHWLPVVDHPSDKATVDFVITAPEHYDVVGSGRLKEISALTSGRKVTHWEETVAIPVKVMTIGVARFAMEISGEIDHIPSSTWVYPQNRAEGFHDFTVAVRIFEFFHRNIGPYAYEKLAHVQSKTRWGGLENASNIFYTESSVNGKNDHEGLIAHETAHQWFGNSVTENDWHHVWLSEGFATYFAALYFENAYGVERLREEMKTDRAQVAAYFRKNPNPVVDTTIVEVAKVLSTNSYQKAGWVLHMLRHRIGDEAFWKGIRDYYSTFMNKNAMTSDFRLTMERASGQDLGAFFKQWIFTGGHPVLQVRWSYDNRQKTIKLTVRQEQQALFVFPLDISIRTSSSTPDVMTLSMNAREQTFSIPAGSKPLDIALDPATWLLYEGNITAQ